MKQDVYTKKWISAVNHLTEFNRKTHKEKVFFIVSLKTVFENLNLVKSYNKTNPNVFCI